MQSHGHHKNVEASASSVVLANTPAVVSTASEAPKWKCEVCTYENWPASLRCAMCQSINNKVRSENQHNNRKTSATSSTSDIYKMGATSLSRSTSPQLATAVQATPTEDKWACSLCTYLNWPKALRCTQCLTPRRRVSPGARKELATPPSLECLRIATPSPPSKWNCTLCTYENWPRTRKCVLCGALKEATPTRDNAELVPASPESRRGLSPKGCSKGGGASQTLNAEDIVVTESNWDYERRMRTFRRRLKEADWTWLTACMGVVEGDMNPVEAYLNTGGDPTRKLTNPEVALLNRPSIYEAGHTLVHLAIKYANC